MSQPRPQSIPPATAGEIPQWWITAVREAVQRDRLTLRGGFPDTTIEVQVPDRPDVWQPLNLQTNTKHFASEKDRDAVLNLLIGKAPANPEEARP
jgi:hypothetical protein